MAIAFVNNALGGTTDTTSFSITLPATSANDIIILEYCHRGTGDATLGGTYSGPAFTEKHDQQFTGSLGATCSGKTLWSRATGNHSGQTVTGSSLTNSCASIVTVYSGCRTSGDPLAGATIVGENNSSADSANGQLTLDFQECVVVLVVANSPDVGVSAQTAVGLGTMTERAELLSTGGTDTAISHASLATGAAGHTGNLTWTNGGAQDKGSWGYALIPQDITVTNVGSRTLLAATSITAFPPSAIVAGDNALINITSSSSSATVTPPASVTLLKEGNPADFTPFLYKLNSGYTGSEDLTFSITSSDVSIDMYRIPGYQVDVAGTPSDVAATNVITGSVTPTGNDEDVVSFATCDATGGARTWTQDSGSEILDRHEHNLHRNIARKTISGGAGASQSIQHTITSTAQDLSATAVALSAVVAGRSARPRRPQLTFR